MTWRLAMLLIVALIVYRVLTGTHGDDWPQYHKTALAVMRTYKTLVAIGELQIAESDAGLPRVRSRLEALDQIAREDPSLQARLQALEKAIPQMSGEAGFAQLRRLTENARQKENRLLESRFQQSEAQAGRSQRSAKVGGSVILALLALATLVLELDLRKRRRAEAVVRESREQLEQANESLERRVAQRTAELAEANLGLALANKELEAFSYSVSHDLRAPLRSVHSFSQIVLEEYADRLDEEGVKYLKRVRAGAQSMGQLIEDLLNLSRLSRAPLRRELVNLSALALKALDDCRNRDPDRIVTAGIAPDVQCSCDHGLAQVVFDNLIGNAWKYSSKREGAHLEFGSLDQSGQPVYFVRDNGAGFDMAYSAQLFAPFQRLHNASEFEGTGIGLATVQRIIQRHGGRIWAESSVGAGAAFYFTLTQDSKETEQPVCQTSLSSS